MNGHEKTLEVTFSEMKFKNFVYFLYRSPRRLVILRWVGPQCLFHVVVKMDFEQSEMVKVVLKITRRTVRK